MNAVILINQLAEQDIRLWLEQEQLRYSAPDGAMTGELIALLRQYKTSIITFLQQSEKTQLAIPQVEGSDDLAVSFAQQRLWFMQKLDPHSSALHIHTALDIKGALDVGLLEQACKTIIDRHSILRSVYYQKNGVLLQSIKAHYNWQIEQQNVNSENINQAIQTDSQQSFDLSQAPLVRCTLFHLGEQHCIASLTVHHIAADGWSLGIFVQELISIYQALVNKQNHALPALQRQYADFAAWQTSDTRQNELEEQLSYWQNQLAGVPTLDLPTNKARTAQVDNRAATVQRQIPMQGIQSLNQRFNSTLFSSMMALFSSLLYRYSQQADFCIGTPVAGRPASVLEPLIGCFINVLAIRCEPDAQLSFSEYLQTIKKSCNNALKNQDLPFEQVVQALNIPRDLSTTPLFNTMLSVQNAPFEQADLADLQVEALPSEEIIAQFDLKLTVQEQGADLFFAFEYKKALFEESFIERMADHFVALCQAASAQPEQHLQQLPIFRNETATLQNGEQNNGFNATQQSFADLPLLHSNFEKHAALTPDAIAVHYQDSALSYRELNERANQLANYLVQQGAAPGQLIAICLERSLDLMVSLLAVLKSGAAYVPVDPDFPPQRIQHIINDSQALLCISHSKHAKLFDANSTLLCLDQQNDIASFATDKPQVDISANDLAYVLYTSGSTGNPKGVMIEHASLMHYLSYANHAYMADLSASVVSSTISFDATITTLFTPFLSGKSVILCQAEDAEFNDLSRFILQDDKNYLFKITPAHLDFLGNRLNKVSSQAKHCFVIGGEQLLNRQLDKWLYHLASEASYINEYGPTEATVGCCVLKVDKQSTNNYRDYAAVPIGKPIANTQLYVLDAIGQAVPQGISGELYIAGPGLARAYLNLHDATADSFTQHDFSHDHSKRLYKTGDLVRQLESGDLQYLGRLDEQVKLRGQRIELGEIEAAIQSFADIKSAAAAMVQHGDDKRLAAWYEADSAIDESALRQHISKRLAAFMLPAAIVAVDHWPLSPNGKINKNKLPQPDWGNLNRKPYEAPSTATQKQLTEIWQQVLGVEKIGIHDNFFEMGGHSLTAAQALALAQEQFHVELPLRQLFDSPDIETIARLIDQALLEQQILQTDDSEEESESFIL